MRLVMHPNACAVYCIRFNISIDDGDFISLYMICGPSINFILNLKKNNNFS